MKTKPGRSGAIASADLVCRKISLPATVAQAMIRALQTGQWTGELPGERKLCELLQVSRVTLRPALRQLEREGWLRTVPGQRRAVVAEIKTVPASAPSGKIILISPLPLHEIEPFVLLGIDNLRELLARRHMLLETETRPECYGHSPAGALERLCREFRPDVWLLWRSTRAMQEWFQGQKHRHVVLGSVFQRDSSPSVDIDHVATAHHAATTFGRMGHRRIAVIVADSTLAGDLRSVEGFCAGADEYRPGPLRAETVRHDGTAAGVVRSVDRVLGLVPRPTGIFSAGGRQTIAIMTRLLQLGIRIPQEMSVISRDDDYALDFVTPAPGRYYRPPIKFARGVFRQIERQLTSSSQEPRAFSIFPDFLPKETLARPAGGS
ncbi:MAG: substrate-binding domain-containing protein [Verrucomicrobia bacterium]|nr:substrate-binding domain-containing protein [Verrucomicrobiota bacterium]